MTDDRILALHRDLVATPSVSGNEGAIADRVQVLMASLGLSPGRFGDNVWAVVGDRGPILCLDSHLDTVPPVPGWTMDPWVPTVRGGRVHGLGSNDAKAAVAAMIGAVARVHAAGGLDGARIVLALVAQEETGGAGTEVLLPEIRRLGYAPDAAVVGEPTGLDVAVAQKGHLVLRLVEEGTACHAAHGEALGAGNALRRLAADLVALDALAKGPAHDALGPVTLEPTMAAAGTAANVIPAHAECTIDVRTNPGTDPGTLLHAMRQAIEGRLEITGSLPPRDIDPGHPLVLAATAARPVASTFGSRGMSDWAHFDGVPAIKAGPGRTERSHTPDEHVLESEILEGAAFYRDLAIEWATRVAGRGRAR